MILTNYNNYDKQIIALDFDGTMVEHLFPAIGSDVPMAFQSALELMDAGHELILWTVRIGKPLAIAHTYCKLKGLKFFGVNENPGQKFWNGSPKAHANIYIDDAAFGCPLVFPEDGRRPYVNWRAIRTSEQFRALVKK